MKNILLSAFFLIALLFTTSCSRSKIQTNYDTTPALIFNLKYGMTLDEVVSGLNIPPKDVYSVIENKTKVVVFKYKLKYQQVNIKNQNNADNLRGGPERYKNEKNLYVVFDATTNKLLYYVTESGRANAAKAIGISLKFRLKSVD